MVKVDRRKAGRGTVGKASEKEAILGLVIIAIGLALYIAGWGLIVTTGAKVVLDESFISVPRTFSGEVEIGTSRSPISYKNISSTRNVTLYPGREVPILNFTVGEHEYYYPLIITLSAHSEKPPIQLSVVFYNLTNQSPIGFITPTNSSTTINGQYLVDAELHNGSYTVKVLSNSVVHINELTISGLQITRVNRTAITVRFSPETAYTYAIKYVKGIDFPNIWLSASLITTGTIAMLMGFAIFILSKVSGRTHIMR